MVQKNKKWRTASSGLAFSLALLVSACGGGGGGGNAEPPVDPADADALTVALNSSLGVKVGPLTAVLSQGNLPASTSDASGPKLETQSDDTEFDGLAGEFVDIPLRITSVGDFAASALFAKIPGAASYFEIDLNPGNGKAWRSAKDLSTSLALSIVLPESLIDGRFCVDIKSKDERGMVSDPVQVCISIGDLEPDGTAVVQALQGTWYYACNAGDNESFSGSVAISGNNITFTETKFEGTTSCAGQPSSDSPYTEELTFVVGSEVTASDGNPAFELDLTNVTEGGTSPCIVRVEQSSFRLGCGDGSRPTTLDSGVFTREQEEPVDGAAFTNEFFSGRVLYLNGSDDVQQLNFAPNGTGTILFRPFEGNDFSTGDVNTTTWSVSSAGRLLLTEMGSEGVIYNREITPTQVSANSADFTFTVTNSAESGSLSGAGTMKAANKSLYDFLSGRSFSTDVEDVERLTFSPEGTGSIRFFPGEFNDFDTNDVNGVYWEAVSGTILRFTELGGDGFDRDETGCESNPQIDCDLNYYDIEFVFSQRGANSASFSYTIKIDGAVEVSGSGTMQAE